MENRIGEGFNIVEKEELSSAKYWSPETKCSIVHFLRNISDKNELQKLESEIMVIGLDDLIFSVASPKKIGEKIRKLVLENQDKLNSNFKILVFPVEAKIETNDGTYLHWGDKEFYLKHIFSDRLHRVASGLCRVRGTHLE